MTYTSHGQHIEGTDPEYRSPTLLVECGGPGKCEKCSAEATEYMSKYFPHLPSTPDEPVTPATDENVTPA